MAERSTRQADVVRAVSHDKDLVPGAVIIRIAGRAAATRRDGHEFQKLIGIRLSETGGTYQ